MIALFDKIRLYKFGRLLAGILVEPIAACSVYWDTFIFRLKKLFRISTDDPNAIKERYLEKPALILLHGNCHDPSAWNAFHKSWGDRGPIFTVQLHSWHHRVEDVEAVHKKIEFIRALYAVGRKKPEIFIVGHSRGAEVCFISMLTRSSCHIDETGTVTFEKKIKVEENIKAIFCLGSPVTQIFEEAIDPKIAKYIYEIDGLRDVMVKEKSLKQDAQKLSVNTGHLGLLYHTIVHRQVIKWIEDILS